MKIGRNQPCPCGSGIKYKKCCLGKESSKEPEPTKELEPVEKTQKFESEFDKNDLYKEKPPPPVDPLLEEKNKAWGSFEKLELEQQPAFFLQLLDKQPELMDGENAFSMLDQLFNSMDNEHQKEHLFPLLDQFKEKLPEIYEKERHYCLGWRIEALLNLEEYDSYAPFALEFAEISGEHPDNFFQILDRLVFHNQLSVLVEVLRIACPVIKDAKKVMSYTFYEAADLAIRSELFLFLEQNPNGDPLAPDFLKTLEYTEFEKESFTQLISSLSQEDKQDWKLEEFALQNSIRERDDNNWDDDDDDDDDEREEPKSDPPADNLRQLSYQFLRFLHQKENVPYAKAETARRQIISYIRQRHAGELQPQESMFESIKREKRRSKSKKSKRKPGKNRQRKIITHILCPDSKTMDRFMGQKMSFMSWKYYDAFGFFEVIPAWLRFLVHLDLLDEKQQADTITKIKSNLLPALQKVAEQNDDPVFSKSLEGWESPEDNGVSVEPK